jgi:hypothetical protein
LARSRGKTRSRKSAKIGAQGHNKVAIVALKDAAYE